MEKRKRFLGELPHNSELFLTYDISTPEGGETKSAERNRAIDINAFTLNYVHYRESQLAPLKLAQLSPSKRNSRSSECVFMKKKPKEVSLPPLKFTEEVINSRGDPCLSSYFSMDMKKLYKLKDLTISKQRKRKDSSKANGKRSLPQKHTLCMPCGYEPTGFPSKSKYLWKKELEENNFLEDQAGKASHLWEKHVLGLISRQTAQWIANQCSKGEQRSRLISFLDEKYKIEDVERDGAATVYKILSINDDAVSPPVRKGEKTVVGSETIHRDT